MGRVGVQNEVIVLEQRHDVAGPVRSSCSRAAITFRPDIVFSWVGPIFRGGRLEVVVGQRPSTANRRSTACRR